MNQIYDLLNDSINSDSIKQIVLYSETLEAT
jgi:hypothetical protein